MPSAPAAMSQRSNIMTSTRSHYIDWLRNLGILYLFPYHTARVFDGGEPYYVQGEPSVIATGLMHVSYWFMPLLFLVAGMASLHALRRRTGGAYVKERVLRLFVPLIAGLILVVPPQAYFAQLHQGMGIGYLEFLAGYFTDWSDLTGYFGTFTPGQLWFIAFLFVISVALAPVMAVMNGLAYSARMLRRPVFLVLVFLGIAILSAMPDISGKNIFVYAGYFFAGYLLATDERIMESVTQHRRAYLLVAIAGVVGILVEFHTIGWQHGLTPSGIAFTLGHYFVFWVTLLAILGYGRRYLNKPHRVMAYLNHAAYPLFIVHQTWILLLAYFVVPVVPGSPLQFVVIMIGSLLGSVATYEGIRRVAPLRVLFGVKSPAPTRP